MPICPFPKTRSLLKAGVSGSFTTFENWVQGAGIRAVEKFREVTRARMGQRTVETCEVEVTQFRIIARGEL